MDPAVQWLHIIGQLGDDILTWDDTRSNVFRDLRNQYSVLTDHNVNNWKSMCFDIDNAFVPYRYRDDNLAQVSYNDLTPFEKIGCYLWKQVYNDVDFEIDLRHEARLALDLILYI
jgi:hypothetical protein